MILEYGERTWRVYCSFEYGQVRQYLSLQVLFDKYEKAQGLGCGYSAHRKVSGVNGDSYVRHVETVVAPGIKLYSVREIISLTSGSALTCYNQ